RVAVYMSVPLGCVYEPGLELQRLISPSDLSAFAITKPETPRYQKWRPTDLSPSWRGCGPQPDCAVGIHALRLLPAPRRFLSGSGPVRTAGQTTAFRVRAIDQLP